MNEATLAIAIVFGILTIFLALRLAKRKKPVWTYKTERVMGLGSDAPPELKLLFGSIPVENVYKTRFIFFNKGTQTINREDVTEKITINFKKSKILREPLQMSKSKEAIKFLTKRVIKGRDNLVQLDFLYLDHNDGAVVEVLHTKSEEISCSGNIKDAEIRKIGEFKQYYEPYYRSRAMPFAIMVTMLAAIFLHNTFTSEPETKIITVMKEDVAARAAFSVLLGFFLSCFIYETVQHLRRRGFPKWSIIIQTSTD